MVNNTRIMKEPDQNPRGSVNQVRKSYDTPCLKKLGDLRALTLGGTYIEPGDSAFPNTSAFPP